LNAYGECLAWDQLGVYAHTVDGMACEWWAMRACVGHGVRVHGAACMCSAWRASGGMA